MFDTPIGSAERAWLLLAVFGGVAGLIGTFRALLRPVEGSAAWARARMRKL
jgi:hypothetical protein